MCHVLASSSEKDVQQNSPTISIVVATLRKSSSLTCHTYCKLLIDATCDCLHLRLSSAPSLLLSWVGSSYNASRP